ncbi:MULTISPECIES: TIGR03899 family protein [Thalassotalea]|uniref:TIGR03899 family protein n=1 Tax=Thalassotalea castellviae TaxID=3075612 RepID=A0ABU3A4A9_9GAMM|nr:TIGR03899 family protein [Thalassotalea sp. W431]MDT0605017.1 TIGR03899 family protein [Thalassotalea sp. W431]
MKVSKTSTASPITLSVENEKSVITAPEKNTKSQTQSAANPSTQMQLMGLAKQFVIDGALLPLEKQPPIEERSKKRERITHLRKQQNLEHIIQRAIQYCSDEEVADRADQDWFNNFINLAEDVSNKTMQDLWAKILAGEISSPGSFSLKSLQAFKTMSINEAKLLAKACAIAIKDQSNKSMRIISGASQTPGLFNFFSKDREHRINLSPFGLSYAELLTLADNHLIFIQETETAPIAAGENISFVFNGINLSLKANKNNSLLTFYKFTPIGTELAQLIADNPEKKYLHLLKQETSSLFQVNY